MADAAGVEVYGPAREAFPHILTPEALDLVAALQRELGSTRDELLRHRLRRQAEFEAGTLPDFLESNAGVRSGDRRVEITGPTDRKMLINALNSGAKVFMADFEDANCPTWRNLFEGQANLIEAIERTITFEGPEGRRYQLDDEVAVLLVRPRGWHLPEKHVLVDGRPASGSLVDFGLYFFHNAARLLARGTGPASRAGPSRRPCSSRPSPPPSRWRRSSTSCGSTRPGSTPGAGTTCSRSSRSSARVPSSPCPTATRSL